MEVSIGKEVAKSLLVVLVEPQLTNSIPANKADKILVFM
jgi:hypothetical protein